MHIQLLPKQSSLPIIMTMFPYPRLVLCKTSKWIKPSILARQTLRVTADHSSIPTSSRRWSCIKLWDSQYTLYKSKSIKIVIKTDRRRVALNMRSYIYWPPNSMCRHWCGTDLSVAVPLCETPLRQFKAPLFSQLAKQTAQNQHTSSIVVLGMIG